MSITHRVIKQCYYMAASERYRRLKSATYDLLENPKAPIRPYFDIFMIGVVLASVWMLIYEVKHDLGWVGVVFEPLVVVVFVVEYLLRFWIFNDSHKVIITRYERAEFINEPFRLWPALGQALKDKLRYIIQPLSIIDLLAIIPSYRPLRFLRIFLLFRIFKLFRYTRSISEFVKVLSEKRIELLTLFIFMAFITFTAATAMYFFETDGAGHQISGFFDSVYWALVTMSTVGYGDITPQTNEGRIVAIVLIIAGLGVISFFTSIIVSAFGEKIHEIRAHRAYAEVERNRVDTLVCGFGRVGQVVAERLARDNRAFVVVDPRAGHAPGILGGVEGAAVRREGEIASSGCVGSRSSFPVCRSSARRIVDKRITQRSHLMIGWVVQESTVVGNHGFSPTSMRLRLRWLTARYLGTSVVLLRHCCDPRSRW